MVRVHGAPFARSHSPVSTHAASPKSQLFAVDAPGRDPLARCGRVRARESTPPNAERSGFAEVTWSDVSEIVSWDEHDQSCCGSRNAEWLADSQLHHSGPIIDKA